MLTALVRDRAATPNTMPTRHTQPPTSNQKSLMSGFCNHGGSARGVGAASEDLQAYRPRCTLANKQCRTGAGLLAPPRHFGTHHRPCCSTTTPQAALKNAPAFLPHQNPAFCPSPKVCTRSPAHAAPGHQPACLARHVAMWPPGSRPGRCAPAAAAAAPGTAAAPWSTSPGRGGRSRSLGPGPQTCGSTHPHAGSSGRLQAAGTQPGGERRGEAGLDIGARLGGGRVQRYGAVFPAMDAGCTGRQRSRGPAGAERVCEAPCSPVGAVADKKPCEVYAFPRHQSASWRLGSIPRACTRQDPVVAGREVHRGSFALCVHSKVCSAAPARELLSAAPLQT